MHAELEIKFTDSKKAVKFKKHIEKTHPSTMGKINIKGPCIVKSNDRFKFDPMAQAKRVTKLL